MCFFDRQRGVDKEDLPDEMGQVITKCVREDSDEFPKQVSRNKKRDRQGREKVPERVNIKQVTSYELQVTRKKTSYKLQVTRQFIVKKVYKV